MAVFQDVPLQIAWELTAFSDECENRFWTDVLNSTLYQYHQNIKIWKNSVYLLVRLQGSVGLMLRHSEVVTNVCFYQ